MECRQCHFCSEAIQFTEHLHQNGLKCLNPQHRKALYNAGLVAFDLPVQIRERLTECYVCLVCKNCEVKDLYAGLNDKDQKAEFLKLHQSRCGERFSEIADLLKPSAHELSEAVGHIKSKKRPACPKCGYDAKGNEYNLKRHMAYCQGPKKQKATSCICGYSDIRNLKRHMDHCKALKKEKTSEPIVGSTEPPPLPPSPPPENTVVFETSRSPSPIVRNEGLIQAFDILRSKFEPDNEEDDQEDEDGNVTRKVYSEMEIVNVILQETNELMVEVKAAKADKWRLESAARKLVGDTRRNLSIEELVEEMNKISEGIEDRIAAQERIHAREIAYLKKQIDEKNGVIETFGTIKFNGKKESKVNSDSDSDWD